MTKQSAAYTVAKLRIAARRSNSARCVVSVQWREGLFPFWSLIAPKRFLEDAVQILDVKLNKGYCTISFVRGYRHQAQIIPSVSDLPCRLE